MTKMEYSRRIQVGYVFRLEEVIGKHPTEVSAPIQPGGERAEALARKYIAAALANGSARLIKGLKKVEGARGRGVGYLQSCCGFIYARRRWSAGRDLQFSRCKLHRLLNMVWCSEGAFLRVTKRVIPKFRAQLEA